MIESTLENRDEVTSIHLYTCSGNLKTYTSHKPTAPIPEYRRNFQYDVARYSKYCVTLLKRKTGDRTSPTDSGMLLASKDFTHSLITEVLVRLKGCRNVPINMAHMSGWRKGSNT